MTIPNSGTSTYYNWDVTPYVQGQWTGDKQASLVVKANVEASSVVKTYGFESHEWQSSAYGPFLDVDLPSQAINIAQVQFFYRYSADNVTWSAWTLAQTATTAPWAANFTYPNGFGYSQFYSVATDSSGATETAHSSADTSVQYQPVLPVAGNYSMGASRDQSNTLSTSKLLRVCTSAYGSALSLTGVSPVSQQGGTVQLNGSAITYTPAPGVSGTDTFTYTVTDAAGGSAQGVVTVTIATPTGSGPNILGISADAASVSVRMAGIPNLVYQVQASTNLFDWGNVGWSAAGSNGLFQFIDVDKNVYPYRFYRTVTGQIPSAKISVFSDPHYMDPSLLIADGVAFQTYLAQDRKMLAQSASILDSVITSVSNAQPNIVLVTGDLTKDGELVSHLAVSNQLQTLKNAGIKVFVCPGNHDVNNPDAMSFNGDTATPVPNIQSNDFAAIYAPFGYADAIARDSNSLAYVVEPVPGLLILSMDACHYERNTNGSPFTGGYFNDARLGWITNQLAAARDQGKFVIGMVHHGVMEHYTGQKTLFPDYVIDNYQSIDQIFASYGMKVVFTGHYHAQDVAMTTLPAGALFDIETGSTVTYPCPYRVIDLNSNGVMTVNSYRVTDINYDLGGQDFQTFAANFEQKGLMGLSTYMLMAPPYSLPQSQAAQLAPAMTEAFMSHYQGDESTRPISAQTQGIISYLSSINDPNFQFMAYELNAIFHDPAPSDNNLTINLLSGSANP